MIWILAGVIPPFLWALVNHTDKYLISKSHHKSSVNVLMVYSTGFSLFLIPFLYWFARKDLIVNIDQILIQIVGGILIAFSIYFYLKALFKDEASIVAPFFLLVPVFGYFFSYFILDEVLSFKQIIACALILFGALILSLEINEESKFKLNHGVLFFMVLSTFSQALQETLFKFSTVNNSFVASLFWLQIGVAIFGVFLLFLNRNLFSHFLESIRVNRSFIFGVNFVSELVSSVAYMVRDYALLLAPIFVIMTLNGFQPAFVFIIGTILTILFPRFIKEKIRPIHLVHKGVAISIMIAGTILIAQTL